MSIVSSFLRDESGQGIVEYGLIIGLIAMVAVGALLMVGGNVNSSLQDPLDSTTTTSGTHVNPKGQ